MKKLLVCLLVLSVFSLSAEDRFDEKYAVEITGCHGRVKAPSIFAGYHRDDWQATIFIHFGNGLWGAQDWYVKNEFHAQEYSKFTYNGCVNISSDREECFYFIEEDTKYRIPCGSLFVNSYHVFENLPVVQFVVEQVETKSSWFRGDTQIYHYSIELSDNTIWHVQPKYEPLQDSWLPGHRVTFIGNTDSPCLINIDASLAKDRSVVYINLLPSQSE